MERLSDYGYDLPEALIAQTPLADRAGSRLLHLERGTGVVHHRGFRDAIGLLREGDLLVLNDTRVSAVRLYGHKETGAAVEALLLREEAPGAYEALVRPGKRLRVGARIVFPGDLVAEVAEERPEGRKLLRFESRPDLEDRLAEHGLAPLPPYIHAPLADRERYQTVYAAHGGSAAAPTAGLHFTPEILAELRGRGIQTANVTLHVGLDTFRPVTVEDPSLHPIHGERCGISQDSASKIANSSGRIIAVGTTSVRTLETFAVGDRRVETGERLSTLFIRPGYRFRVVDGMFTNFHMPHTTMLMMLSALAGRENVMNAYAEAVRERYRFLSFGDSMLIL
ncbi:MAG: tRNA preQ1(34) S-adenosylmethionine ribosyltransferase-isomerase QueA [Fimbriimonas sp.]